ncbi:MAG: PP2C family serine/threonine-protein phosphatase [Candidatus Zixiibacteriota bacterium]
MRQSKWRVSGASVIGTNHKRFEIPCQDAFAYQESEGGILLVAVADGAGSKFRSGEGAQHAVETMVTALEEGVSSGRVLDDEVRRAIIFDAYERARSCLQKISEREEELLSAFATTLTCVLAASEWISVGQVGDGVVVYATTHDKYKTAIKPQKGEYANATYFLSDPGALSRVEVHHVNQPVEFVAVMTDGLLRLATLRPDYTPYEKFFQPVKTFLLDDGVSEKDSRLADFLDSERVCSLTDDDKTLVIAARETAAVEEEGGEG